MTKVAMWCRHEADNLIGIGDDIPWHIPSDSRFFADVIAGQDVVFGRKTYETVPPEVLSDCAVWVLSKNQNYEPRNPDTERLVGDVRAFKEFEGDLYIGGGAAVYLQFMDGRRNFSRILLLTVFTAVPLMTVCRGRKLR